MNIFFDTFHSPLGVLYLVFSSDALTEIRSGNETETAQSLPFRKGKAPAQFIKQLGDYFNGSPREFNQKIVFSQGTDFEKKVWLCLREIPYGETRTYKWLAERIGRPKAVRAVGQALSRNPIPIVLPCHRVIMSDGSLGGYSLGAGYSSGVDIKRRLLELEYYAKQSMGKKIS